MREVEKNLRNKESLMARSRVEFKVVLGVVLRV
jgi:hypothetical protein